MIPVGRPRDRNRPAWNRIESPFFRRTHCCCMMRINDDALLIHFSTFMLSHFPHSDVILSIRSVIGSGSGATRMSHFFKMAGRRSTSMYSGLIRILPGPSGNALRQLVDRAAAPRRRPPRRSRRLQPVPGAGALEAPRSQVAVKFRHASYYYLCHVTHFYCHAEQLRSRLDPLSPATQTQHGGSFFVRKLRPLIGLE